MSSISRTCSGTGPGIRHSWMAGLDMSTGRRLAGFDLERDSVKSDARMRKSAVWVSAERGIVRCEVFAEVRNWLSHCSETGRDFVLWR